MQPVARSSDDDHAARDRLRVLLRTSLLFALLAFAPAAGAQSPAPPVATPPAPAEARDVRSYTLLPERREKAVAYSRAKYRLHFAGFAWGVAVLVLIVALRVAPRFRDLAEKASRRRFVQALVFVPLLFLVVEVSALPIDLYRHHLARVYDQSVQTFGSWLQDWGKGFLVTLVITIPIVAALYGILRRNPRHAEECALRIRRRKHPAWSQFDCSYRVAE